MQHATGAVVRVAGGPFIMEDVSLDDLRDDEVLVEIVAAGICHTDLSGRDQSLPFPLPAILGHEGAGFVRATGRDVSGVSPGDRVLLSQAFCGSCDTCATGAVAYCDHMFPLGLGGVRLDGSAMITDRTGARISGGFLGQSSFATHAIARAVNVFPVADHIAFELAAPLGCGVQTGAGTILNALRPPKGSSVAIFGAGTVGLSAAMAARVAACPTVIVVDVDLGRLELALELGATHVVDARSDDPVAAITSLTSGGADFSVEATGVPSVGTQAVNSLGKRGTCALVGSAPFGSVLEVDWTTLLSGRTVRGVVFGESDPATFLPTLFELHDQGDLPVERLIRTYEFARLDEAIHDMESGSTIKPVLVRSINQ